MRFGAKVCGLPAIDREFQTIDYLVLFDRDDKSAEARRFFGPAPKFSAAIERDYLTRILKLTQGSVAQAARLARRNRTEFYKLLQRHRLEPAMFKETKGS